MIAHLIDQREEAKGNELWTRVASRSNIEKNQIGQFRIVDDLNFDHALRKALSNQKQFTGSIEFSPL